MLRIRPWSAVVLVVVIVACGDQPERGAQTGISASGGEVAVQSGVPFAGGEDSPAPPLSAEAERTPPSAMVNLDPTLVEEGRAVFAGPGNCAMCHGPLGQGSAIGPDLSDREWIWIGDLEEDLLGKVLTLVRTGIDTPRYYSVEMPPAGALLDERQLRAVAAYVLSLSR